MNKAGPMLGVLVGWIGVQIETLKRMGFFIQEDQSRLCLEHGDFQSYLYQSCYVIFCISLKAVWSDLRWCGSGKVPNWVWVRVRTFAIYWYSSTIVARTAVLIVLQSGNRCESFDLEKIQQHKPDELKLQAFIFISIFLISYLWCTSMAIYLPKLRTPTFCRYGYIFCARYKGRRQLNIEIDNK